SQCGEEMRSSLYDHITSVESVWSGDDVKSV
ncbi:hypothetical protein RRG08_065396, partial [Elysia crispata]